MKKEIDLIDVTPLKRALESKRLELSSIEKRIIKKMEFYEIAGAACNLSGNGLQMIIKGYAAPSLYKALLIAEYLNTDIKELFIIKK